MKLTVRKASHFLFSRSDLYVLYATRALRQRSIKCVSILSIGFSSSSLISLSSFLTFSLRVLSFRYVLIIARQRLYSFKNITPDFGLYLYMTKNQICHANNSKKINRVSFQTRLFFIFGMIKIYDSLLIFFCVF